MDKLIGWFKNRGPFVATLVLLLAIPIYPKFPLQAVEGTYVAIRVVDILTAGGILFCLISQILKGFPLLKSRIFKLFLLYWTAGLIANIAGFGITGLPSYRLAILHWIRRIQYMSLFFLAYQSVNNKRDIKDIKRIVSLAFLFVFLYSMGQKFFHLPVISTMNEEFSKGRLLFLDKWTRISSTFAGHYDLASWLVMFLAIIPTTAATAKKWLGKVISFILGILGIYLLVLTASRVSFIAYLIAITATLVLLKKFRWLILVLTISLFFAFTSKELNARLRTSLKRFPAVDQKIAQITEIWETESNRVGKKIKEISLKRKKPTPTSEVSVVEPTPEEDEQIPVQPDEDAFLEPEKEKIDKEVRTWPTPEEAAAAAARSSNIRFAVEWPRAVKAFQKNPLTGTGYSSLGLATDNDYLRAAGETGIIGLGSFILINLHLLVFFWKKIRNKSHNWQYSAGFIGIIIGILANGLYIDVFEASKVAFYYWMLMGIGYKISNLQFSNFQK